MTNYKSTLNLPFTAFPMKANLAQKEPDILKKWERLQIYERLTERGQEKEKFILHLGPPYANGQIHLGTATTTILKDIIVKAKTLSGFYAPLVPGWDCHGLPIELNVEKKIGKPGMKLSAKVFREACREYANTYIDIQAKDFKRLGILADWKHPYLTMDFRYEANTIRALADIIRTGHLQKGYKPVHWCLDCASALAEAEVEYAEKTSIAIDVRFKVLDAPQVWELFAHPEKNIASISLPIWTTTPWTLPANEAVALNATEEYLLLEDTDKKEQFIIAKKLLSSILTRYDIAHYQQLGEIEGEKLAGLKLLHPFYDKEVPLIVGDHVTVESGTGAVHIAPAHGTDDYLLGLRYQLPLYNPVGDNGCFLESTPLFAGIHVTKVNADILHWLKEKNALLHQATFKHSYPHCWRHKTPLIFRATPQWFISMEQKALRQMALHAIKTVNWIPEWGESRIQGMIANRPDWCISRQRIWGVPLSIFIHKETGDLHPDTLDLMERVAQRVELEGVEAWYRIDSEDFLKEDAKHYQKCKDVLDVWFDSGVSHACVLKVRPELCFPADMVLEGSDQHRGWFQSSLLTSVAINQIASYKTVLTHGFVVDGQGRKMSKSIGNVIAPEEIVKTLGADILRLWVASIDYRAEIGVSHEILTRMAEVYRRLRNTARFLLANLHHFEIAQHEVSFHQMLALDRFVLRKAKKLQDEIIKAYETYQFHVVVQKLQHFCVIEMGGFYLDIIKDRQYTMGKESLGRRSAQTALFHLAHAFVRWLTPILSFTAEEIWQYLPGNTLESVQLTTWYPFPSLEGEEFLSDERWEKIRLVRDAVNKEIETQRNTSQLGSGLEAHVTLYCDSTLMEILDKLGQELRFVLITSVAKVLPLSKAPSHAAPTDIPGLLLEIKATADAKCERCWHRVSDVNANNNYPNLCSRCITNISGAGEERCYA